MRTITEAGAGPCAKRVVTATLIAVDGTRYVSTNYCDRPQPVCPRGDLPSGFGYEICRSTCRQRGHAEANVLVLAGSYAFGAQLYVEGHIYVCDHCHCLATNAGVAGIHIGPPPMPVVAS